MCIKNEVKPTTVELSYAEEINRIKCRCNLLLFLETQQVLFSLAIPISFCNPFLYLYFEEI